MVICLEQGADLHMAQLLLLPLTVSCFSKIQIGFTFLVPAHLGSPGKWAVKRVCVCVCTITLMLLYSLDQPNVLALADQPIILIYNFFDFIHCCLGDIWLVVNLVQLLFFWCITQPTLNLEVRYKPGESNCLWKKMSAEIFEYQHIILWLIFIAILCWEVEMLWK